MSWWRSNTGGMATRAYAHGLMTCTAPLLAMMFKKQSALNPAGPQAERLYGLGALFFWVCVGVYVLVVGMLLLSLLRRRKQPVELDPPMVHPARAGERRLAATVIGAVAVTILLLFVLLIGDYATGRAIRAIPEDSNETFKITGHQWWWEVRYQTATPSHTFWTANEVHIPIGRSVKFQLDSADVIHSFWVPNLQGKKDMIPGHPSVLWLRADKPGTYYGQCAEYCGYQHANMRLVVVAEPQADYQAWLERQRQPATQPSTESQQRGQQMFMQRTCNMCHAIVGTTAGGRLGPDLTHIGSRSMLGAGTIPNTRGHLGGWIVDPQRIKPGNQMPQNPMPGEDLRDLLDYLESLK